MSTLENAAVLDERVASRGTIVKRDLRIIKRIQFAFYMAVKRIFDICFSFIGIIMMLPLALAVKIFYLTIGDTSSIFYKQKRVGKNGKTIYIYKFRSMVKDADKILEEMLKEEKYRIEWDLYQKLEDDPRITKGGKILRKLSLDEVPQFINVLKGDMSLIGPRPLVEGELDAHEGIHEIYESVRPGLTSFWAINGRSNVTYEERLNLEYYYVENMGFWMDIKCIIGTIKVVLRKTGAK